jgi:hypothetical protein
MDVVSLIAGQPAAAAAEASAGSDVPITRQAPAQQQQQHECVLSSLLGQDQLPEMCATPNLDELLTDIGLGMAADGEAVFPMDHLLAPLAAPLLPNHHAAAQALVKQEQLQPATGTAAAVAAAQNSLHGSSSCAARTAMVPIGSGSNGSGGVGGKTALVQHIAAAVASMPGLPLPPGCSLATVEQLSPSELVQWQQVLRLEATLHPAGSQQRKQREAAAEVVGMLASYKEVRMDQQQRSTEQQQQQQCGLPRAPLLSGSLPRLQELQLEPKLPPKGNSEQLLGYLLGRPAVGDCAAVKGSSAIAGGAAGDPQSVALLQQPRAATSASTSMNTAGSGCCTRCGCSTCTCRAMPGQCESGWLGGATAAQSPSMPGSCSQFNEAAAAAAAAAVQRPASSSHTSDQQGIQQQQQQQLRKRRSEVLVSVPSDVDHATRLPRLSMDVLPPLSGQGSGSISNLPDDSAEGLHSHKQRRQGSTDDAAVTSNKPSMQGKSGVALTRQPQQHQAASRQQLFEQQLLEQQQQLEAMQVMHAQGSKMLLLQQQQQQQQEQQPAARQALTAQELEEIEVDLELQQLLLVAQMQVSLSPFDDGSAAAAGTGATAAAAAAAGGTSACFGGLGQLQQPQQGWTGLGALPAYGSMPAGIMGQAGQQQVSFAAAGQQQQQQLLQQELMMQQMMVQQQQQQQLMAQQRQEQMMLQQQIAWCAASAAGQSSSAAAAAGISASAGQAAAAKAGQSFSLDAAMQIAQGKLCSVMLAASAAWQRYVCCFTLTLVSIC